MRFSSLTIYTFMYHTSTHLKQGNRLVFTKLPLETDFSITFSTFETPQTLTKPEILDKIFTCDENKNSTQVFQHSILIIWIIIFLNNKISGFANNGLDILKTAKRVVSYCDNRILYMINIMFK